VTIWDSLVRDRRRCCRRCPPRHFGRRAQPSAIQPVRQAALPNRFDGKWYRADGGNKGPCPTHPVYALCRRISDPKLRSWCRPSRSWRGRCVGTMSN
jgi:hypothetical protein